MEEGMVRAELSSGQQISIDRIQNGKSAVWTLWDICFHIIEQILDMTWIAWNEKNNGDSDGKQSLHKVQFWNIMQGTDYFLIIIIFASVILHSL